MTAVKSVYRVFRSLLFTVIATVLGLVVLLYIALSVPAVTDLVKNRAEKELTQLLGGRVSIKSANIYPFNEVRLHDVSIFSPDGDRCISVNTLGAGIELWRLVTERRVVITYAEIISLNGIVEKKTADSPLNIQFLIDAFKPKKQKAPSQIEVVLHNVVIRKSALAFKRPYLSSDKKPISGSIDFSDIEIFNLNADLAFPNISKEKVEADIRRIAFMERSGLDIRSLSLKTCITPDKITLSDFKLKVGNSEIGISDQTLTFDGYKNLLASFETEPRSIGIAASPLFLSDFSALVPFFRDLNTELSLKAGLYGTSDDLKINDLDIRSNYPGSHVSLAADLKNLRTPDKLFLNLKSLDVSLTKDFSGRIIKSIPGISPKIADIVSAAGNLEIITTGSFDMSSKKSMLVADIKSAVGDIDAKGTLQWGPSYFSVSDLALKTSDLRVGLLTANSEVGNLTVQAEGAFSVKDKNFEGKIQAVAPYVEFRGNRIENIKAEVEKERQHISGIVDINDEICSGNVAADIILDGPDSKWDIDASISHMIPALLGVKNFSSDQSIQGSISADLTGNAPDNLAGYASLYDLSVRGGKYPLSIDRLGIEANVDGDRRSYQIDSDFLSGSIKGNFAPTDLIAMVSNLLHNALPRFIKSGNACETFGQYADIDITLKPADMLFDLLKLPVRPGVPVTVNGTVDGDLHKASLTLSAPYLIQGKNKLIKNTGLDLCLSDSEPAQLKLATSVPMKSERANVAVDVVAVNANILTDLRWSMQGNPANKGKIGIDLDIAREMLTNSLALKARIKDSSFAINGADWLISPAIINFADKTLDVRNLRIAHGAQFIDINGSASEDPMDILTASLAGIDLEYIFDILNIKHVDFAGVATGKAMASQIFSGNPVAKTDGLFVKNLAYNGCVVGDGQLESHWDNEKKMIAINADILAADTASTKVRGGIYLKKDSLSFDFIANKTNLGLLQPFMKGFTSDVRGKASGLIKLYGSFKDVDLGGRVLADTITIKVDQTNVYYSGSDSVFFSPGKISIPHIRLYDRYGNSGILRGEVTHEYLRDAGFRFELNNARNLLAYNTDASDGLQWYGKVFASGEARLWGTPGLVAINLDMSTAKSSSFTISLDETRTAAVYNFLTFSDKNKKVELVEETGTLDFEKQFAKKVEEQTADSLPTLFTLDMALDVTPDASMTLIMDPAAGDKIRATGSGALQMHYDNGSDDMSIYGKYVLDQGNYNFSLQDLILKNFTIRPGSSISFNGDPLEGILDITAAYRVNTNLADLDASFRDDPDLKRTSVPVDALLKVSGDIDAPEIKFDIGLPTVTAEVERKMRSIVSTEEMMNQQIIYLLALNRFYTPDYSGGEKGGELASVASSTISSQIQNIIGSVTDKFSLAPSIKSEKSDFSDMEFDVALSSKLFDNRLLINGNLGYRDKSTSQTTFIGDFDVEYLLNKSGNFRLKAYNHFNDASYYLKSALTTQGIGIVYRRDFNEPFKFIKDLRQKHKVRRDKATSNDSIKSTETKTEKQIDNK